MVTLSDSSSSNTTLDKVTLADTTLADITLESVLSDGGESPHFSALRANKKLYNYWRIRILYSMIFGYAAFYLVRGHFTMIIPSFCEEFGYTKMDFGWILSINAIVYGLCKFFSGYISDRLSARYFMSGALVVSAGISLLLGWQSSLWVIGFLWTVNACAQSVGAPTCASVFAHWYSPRERGTKWGIWNSSHMIGGALISVLTGYLVKYWGWQWAFWIPAVIVLGLALLLFERLRDTPESLGLPTIEEYQGLPPEKRAPENAENTLRNLLSSHILYNRPLWCFCIANFFLYIVRMGVFNWAPTFLQEAKGSDLEMAGGMIAAFEIMGLVGGMMAGWLSDKYFGGRRGLVAALYTTILFLFLVYFWYVPAGQPWAQSLALVGVGFFVYGPQVLGGVAAVDMVPKYAVGAANGLTGTFAYLGTSVAGVGVAFIADRWGWDECFMFFMAASILSTVFFASTWRFRAASLKNAAE